MQQAPMIVALTGWHDAQHRHRYSDVRMVNVVDAGIGRGQLEEDVCACRAISTHTHTHTSSVANQCRCTCRDCLDVIRIAVAHGHLVGCTKR